MPAGEAADGAAEPDPGSAGDRAADAAPTTDGDDVQGRPRPLLPVLIASDDPRSADPSVCPYLRLDTGDGTLVAPYHSPADEHQCVAYGGPKPQSLHQQELFCLRAEHVDCPRWVRAQAVTGSAAGVASRTLPRATVAAVLVLVLSAGISFGFVIQRGGIDLPVVAGAPTASSPVAIVATPTPVAATDAPSAPATDVPTTAPTGAPSPSPAATPTPTPTAEPTATPTPAPTQTPGPTPTLSPTPPPTPRPTPTPATGTASRYALLTPCPKVRNCYIYTVRAGDNLFSIAHWFGVSLQSIYALNPQYANGAHLRAGDALRMPPPTR